MEKMNAKNVHGRKKSADDNLNKQLPTNHPKSLYALVSADGDRKRNLSARSFKSSSYWKGEHGRWVVVVSRYLMQIELAWLFSRAK